MNQFNRGFSCLYFVNYNNSIQLKLAGRNGSFDVSFGTGHVCYFRYHSIAPVVEIHQKSNGVIFIVDSGRFIEQRFEKVQKIRATIGR